jgi:hypothetical protein
LGSHTGYNCHTVMRLFCAVMRRRLPSSSSPCSTLSHRHSHFTHGCIDWVSTDVSSLRPRTHGIEQHKHRHINEYFARRRKPALSPARAPAPHHISFLSTDSGSL